jgi:hypothetical protein
MMKGDQPLFLCGLSHPSQGQSARKSALNKPRRKQKKSAETLSKSRDLFII